jgi:uncharacterized protein YdhG (YjbR/CyaY superfamily)
MSPRRAVGGSHTARRLSQVTGTLASAPIAPHLRGVKRPTATTIDEYIAGFPADVRAILSELRSTIRRVAPEATEKISYGIPTFYLNGNLVHFAAFERHIGFYPAPSGIAHFKKELQRYKQAKGSVQFPLDEPLPLDVIAAIVAFRVDENSRPKAKRASKKRRS